MPTSSPSPSHRLRERLERAGVQVEGNLEADRRALETLVTESPDRAADLDPLLLELREGEIAAASLPPVIENLRRGRLLSIDAISSVWEAWDLARGERLALRFLRPPWHGDPVWLRRLERGALHASQIPEICPIRWVDHPTHPHQRISLGGPSLADLLPGEDLPTEREIARLLAGGLRGLVALHAAGLRHGGPLPEHLILGENVKLAFFDPVVRSANPLRHDLSTLGATVVQLDPGGDTEVGGLAGGLAETPPATAADCEALLSRCISEILTRRRHQIVLRARSVRRRDGRGQLLRVVRRLERAFPPPVGSACLRAGRDSVLMLIHSDGQRIKGGAAAAAPSPYLPTIFDPIRGLDASAARALMRSWATRATGDETVREQIQRELGADTARTEALCRWVQSRARLRTLRLLLERARG